MSWKKTLLSLLFTRFHYRRNFTIKMPTKGDYVKFKIFERKTKSPFMLYVDFESIPVLEDSGKQNPNLILTKIKNMLLAVMAIS